MPAFFLKQILPDKTVGVKMFGSIKLNNFHISFEAFRE